MTDAEPQESGGAGDAVGAEPDPRFTFANERTFLAWSRTALALVVSGLGVVQLLPPFPGVPWGRHVLGVPLIVFGAVVAVAAYGELGPEPAGDAPRPAAAPSVMPRLLAAVITVIAVIAAVVVLVSALRMTGLSDDGRGVPRVPGDEEGDPGLARARTSLAWTRTALSFAAVGGVVLRKDVFAGLVIMAAAPVIWQLGRLGHRSRRLKLVTATIVAVSLVSLAVAFTH